MKDISKLICRRKSTWKICVSQDETERSAAVLPCLSFTSWGLTVAQLQLSVAVVARKSSSWKGAACVWKQG